MYRIQFIFFTLGICLLVGTACQLTEEGDDRPPNIIFIMADDLGYADLGCYGQKVIKTPHIDQLAAEGLRFTQVYTGSTVCAPSRSVLITGQHTGHTTVRGNNGVGGVVGLGGAAGRIPLNDEDVTIAECLKKAGYTTGMIGKWGLGEPGTTGEPNQQGFDYFFGFLNQRLAHTYYPEFVWRNTQKVSFPQNTNHQQEDYLQNHFLQESLDFIDRHQGEPFFLYLPYTLPHDDYEIDALGHYADSTHWTEDERTYAAMVDRLDKDVGRVLQQLDEQHLTDNTVVFFCSDNGAALRWENRFDSSGALRGRKRDMYEGGIRTPMIIRYPEKIPANEISDMPWMFTDVLPTLCGIAGIAPPEAIDGINLWPFLTESEASMPPEDRIFYWEFHERGYQQALRQGRYKVVRLAPEAAWELYDLSIDPSEAHDIATDYPTIVRRLASMAEAEHTPSHYFPIKWENGRRKVILIGDSTVKNGSNDEELCGWGEVIAPLFDASRVEVINNARGGRSSKTYRKEGLWAESLDLIREGDFVLIQFGHNDGGAIFKGKERGSLPGISDQIDIDTLASTGLLDTVHTYGWYIRQYIEETQAKGAIPIVCSMVARNRWTEGGKVERATDNYGGWTKLVAEEELTYFIDLNERIASVYDTIGEQQLWAKYFKDDHTHTTCLGAELNAQMVVEGIRELPFCPLAEYLLPL